MLNLKIIGNKIEKHRKEKNMTQYELADALFVTHQAVSKWEIGKSIPSIEVLVLITQIFNVSIDYLLDDVEIKRDDYASLLTNFSRETAINRFIQSENPTEDIHKIFYLLSNSERKFIINLIISEKLDLNITVLWSYLNVEERKYLLGVILSNKYNYNLSALSYSLTHEERRMCYLQKNTYNYPLRFTYYTNHKNEKNKGEKK